MVKDSDHPSKYFRQIFEELVSVKILRYMVIRQTFFRQMLEESQFAKLSPAKYLMGYNISI